MTEDDRKGLSAKQVQALPIFASNSNIEEACNLVGISRNCFYDWMKLPQFKSELQKLRSELVESAVSELKINARNAASTLVKLMERDDSPSVQRSAANDILNHVMKFQEMMEIEQRVSALEQQLKSGG